MLSDEPVDETILIARVQSGDAAAFEALVRRYQPELFAFAARRLGNVDAADDILQDIFFKIWERRTLLVSSESIRPYLYRATRNALINFHRDSARADRLIGEARDALYPASESLDSDQTEMLAAVERAIATLPDRCREAWVLVRERGLSYAEAAHVLGVAPGTVHTQVSRAFATIRKAIGPLLALVALVR